MGWGNCGFDSKGRGIGYCWDATCDHPGCEKPIHRGLAYACGGEHGETEYACEGYFCDEHRELMAIAGLRDGQGRDGGLLELCAPCAAIIRAEGLEHDADDEDCEAHAQSFP